MNSEIKVSNIQQVAHFLLHAFRSDNWDWDFRKVQDILGMPKDQIVDILNFFTEAGVIDFQFVPKAKYWKNPNYISPEELRTGHFTLANQALKKHYNEVKLEGLRKSGMRHVQPTLPEVLPKIDTLKSIIDSEDKMALFLEKFAHLNKKGFDRNTEFQKLTFGELSFNANTGDFSYYKTKGTLLLGGQEYKILLALLSNKDYMVTYDELIKKIYPEELRANAINKPKLQTIIGNIKEKLKITGSKKVLKNKDIFKVVREQGYRLFLPVENK
jgi:DNA-binding winged helix-turn-helix (wHTH) protein